MKNREQAMLKMQQRVEAYLLKHSDVTDTLPNFAVLFALLQAGIVDVLDLMEEQESSTDTAVQSKAAVRASLEALLLALSGKAVAYATNKPKPELLPKVKINKSDFDSWTDYVLVSHSKVVCETITAHLTDLEAYHIKPAEVTTLSGLNNSLVEQESLPEVETKDQDEITKAITAKLKDNQKVLKKIDAELLIVRFSEVAFYEEYLSLRKIIVLGKHRLAILGKVINKLTRKGIKGVTILIEGADEATIAALLAYSAGNPPKKTSDKGGFNKKSFIEGTFKVTAKMIGFATQSITVYVRSGETTRILFELQPL